MFKIIGVRSSCIAIHSHRILYSKPNQLKKKEGEESSYQERSVVSSV